MFKFFLCFFLVSQILVAHASGSSFEEKADDSALIYKVIFHPHYPELVKEMEVLCQPVKALRDEDDVHRLDGSVFQDKKYIRILGDIGEKLGVGCPKLSFLEVQEGLLKFVDKNPDFAQKSPLLVFQHTEANLSKEKLQGFIKKFFQTLHIDASGVPGLKDEIPSLARVTSLAYTTAFDALHSQKHPCLWNPSYPMERFLGGIVEDQTTGGCPQGRADRLFREYIAILQHIGLAEGFMENLLPYLY